MMTNVMVEACLNQEIIKIANLIQVKENSACPKSWFKRRPNSSESRICPNAERTEFRSSEVPRFRSVEWTHDVIIVKWHLLIFIWHMRKFCALTNRPPAQSTGTGQWLSTLFHANCSAAQVFVLHPWQYIFALRCRRRSVLQVQFIPLSPNKVILKNFLCMWWWQIYVMVKVCLNQEIIKISNLIEV